MKIIVDACIGIKWFVDEELIEDTDDLMDHALEIAFELGHPVYDCVYAALAERHGGVVISHDQTFLKKLQASRFADLAVPLANVDRLIATPG